MDIESQQERNVGADTKDESTVGNHVLKWKYDGESIDWEELSNLYKVAPPGNKKADDLQTVFGNCMYKCFVFEGTDLVGVGRVLADGVDCAYICDSFPQFERSIVTSET